MKITLLGADASSLRALATLLQPELPAPLELDLPATQESAPALTLLMAPPVLASEAHLAAHRDLQAQLQQRGWSYAVLHGDLKACHHTALQAIAHCLDHDGQRADQTKVWKWQCEKCSDAACEHRMFSDLLKSR
jgi:hypothetical protein